MTELLTVAEMGRADALAVAAGVPSLDLMEAAGKAVADAIAAQWTRRPVSILCGPGNNGGDGFVVARLLGGNGWPVRVGLMGDRAALKGDARINADRWAGAIEPLSVGLLDKAGLVVDALFGAGLARPLDGIARELVEAINRSEVPCVAVDVPSGVFGDSGEIMGDAPRCALTVTFFRKKPAHLMPPGRDLCGKIALADIGIPSSVLEDIRPRTFENTPDLWHGSLRRPDAGSHKYTRGHALIVGGGEMTGAARLAARAARRIGAGMVTIAAPARAVPIYLAGDPGQLVIELDDKTDLENLMGEKKRSAVLVGPGNGVSSTTQRHTVEALRSTAPTVIDADALTVFQDAARDLFSWVRGPCVLTPHDGEFARLFDTSGDRLARARRAADISHAVVLLKGAATVIAAPDGRTVISTATPWLATAGTGDVLAGLIVGLLAQGLAPFEAACAGAWLHSAAGAEIGPGLIAEDISEQLPGILADLFASL
jgi:NAD(P)H-hydrate epimerase